MIRRLVVVFLAAFGGLAGAAAWAGELRLPKPGEEVVPGRFLVVMRGGPAGATADGRAAIAAPEALADAVEAINADLDVKADVLNAALGVLVVTLPELADDEAIEERATTLEALAARPGVAVVEPDYIEHVDGYTPTDPSVSRLYYFGRTNALNAFRTNNQGNAPVQIAVIDSGTLLNHPDLQENLWTQGNYDFGDDDGDVNPDFIGFQWADHGTHVCGTIAAVWDNRTGIAGMCSNVRVLTLKASQAATGGLPISASSNAMVYAADQGVRLANCSFGGTTDSATRRAALDYARDKGLMLICAAGNSGVDNDLFPHYPSSYATEYDNVISVAATNSTNDALASFSNYGQTSVTVAAPGVDVYSTTVSGGPTSPQPTYRLSSGTSMASPVVCGALAELLARDPSLTYLEVRAKLLAAVKPISSLNGRVVTGGLLDVGLLLADTVTAPEVAGLSPITVECDPRARTATFTVDVTDIDGQSLTTTWRVDGKAVQTDTTSNLVYPTAAPGRTVSYTVQTAAHGVVDVEFEAFDGIRSTVVSTTLTTVDTTAPVMIASPDVVVPTDPGRAVAAGFVPTTRPTVTDTCDANPTLTASVPDVFQLGDNTILWTATDADGNKVTFPQLVRVVDQEAPRIVPPMTVTVPVDRGETFATVVVPTPKSFDNVAVTDVIYRGPVDNQFPAGTTSVSWTAVDAAGNQAVAIGEVTVLNTPPIARTGDDVEVRLTPTEMGRVTLDGGGSSDDDGHDLRYQWSAPGVNFAGQGTARATGAFSAGTTLATLTVTDEVGATAVSSVYVTVTPGRIADFRPLQSGLTTYAYYSYLYSFYAWASYPGSPSLYTALGYSYFAYAYAYSTALVTWNSGAEYQGRLDAYKQLRADQVGCSYLATAYTAQETGLYSDPYVYYALLFNYNVYAYGAYDL